MSVRAGRADTIRGDAFATATVRVCECVCECENAIRCWNFNSFDNLNVIYRVRTIRLVALHECVCVCANVYGTMNIVLLNLRAALARQTAYSGWLNPGFWVIGRNAPACI